ncbi:MAG: AMP-binding protein [Fusobacteriaceae bacterium]|jgi:long-chain acyl-CoA synthetase|nr:AMP-binding protein [Fusobacteriaceae bacterium]
MKFIYDRNKTALIYKEKNYSYKDLITNLKYYSTLFEISPQNRIIIYMENRPEYMFSLFAIWDKKCACVAIDEDYKPDQLLYVLNDCNPSYIVTSNKNIENTQKTVVTSKQNIKIINVDEIFLPDEFIPENMELIIEDRAEVAVLLYTSGTTGEPKGVMLTYDNLMSNSDAVKEVDVLNEHDRFLAILPFHHVLPLNITLILPIYFGTFVVILDEMNSESLKKAMKENKITVIVGVPRIYELLHKGIMSKINNSFIAKNLFNMCKKFNSFTLNKIVFGKIGKEFGGCLKLCVSGGAKLDVEIARNLFSLGLPIIEGYGLTETSPLVSFNRPFNRKIGTVGEPIPHVTVMIAPDEELLIKGPNVMRGYYNRPEATKEVIDENGWFHSGDLATYINNFVTIIGRKKEMIVLSNGKNINPTDIENEILRGSDLIKEIAVTEYNNHLIAIVYPDFDLLKKRQITNIKETLKWEIIDQYNLNAPGYRKILEIKTVKDELPKTRLGKIRRFMLTDFLKGHSSDEGEIPENLQKNISIPDELKDTYNIIKENIENNHNVKVFPDSHMELDLGLDSLDMLEIVSFIENSFAIKITEDTLSEMKNVLDIAKYVNDNGGAFTNSISDIKGILNSGEDIELPYFSVLASIVLFIIKPIFFIYFKMKVIGREKIVGDQFIISGNHQSFLDAVYIPISLPLKLLKNTYFLAVAAHFNSPIKKWIAKRSNVILIDVNKNLKHSLQAASKVLKEKKSLVIFPEGARTRDGKMSEFKKTFALLAKEMNVSILPFAIDGAFEALPFGKSFPKRTKITVKFFDLIEPTKYEIDTIVNNITDEITIFLNEQNSFSAEIVNK